MAWSEALAVEVDASRRYLSSSCFGAPDRIGRCTHHRAESHPEAIRELVGHSQWFEEKRIVAEKIKIW